MKEISKKSNLNSEMVVIYIAVLCSSMTGVQILNISLNKIALIPLELFLIQNICSKIRFSRLQGILAIWYFFTVISCIFGLFVNTTLIGFQNKLILYAIQVITIYLPILFFMNKIINPIEKFKIAIIKVAKINSIWAFIQFFCWYGSNFDFNDFIFNKVFKGILGSSWTVWNYEAGTMALRVTGLNSDTAFLAIILILAYCLTNSKLWKFVFFVICVLSMSRAGIVTICIIQLLIVFNSLRMKVNFKKAFIGGAIIICLFMISIYIYTKLPSVQYQVIYALHRFSNITTGNDLGTLRHLTYIPEAFNVWLWDFSLIRKILGVGPRVGGVAFILSDSIKTNMSFSINMLTNAWAIECDIAEIILGHGILGFLIYYILWKIFLSSESDYKYCILSLVIMGIMYNILETTLIQLFIICLLTSRANPSFNHKIELETT